jgi:hypothetical protein
MVLRVADRYAYIDCGSTVYAMGTVYGGKGRPYTPGIRPASSHWRRPARSVDDARLG